MIRALGALLISVLVVGCGRSTLLTSGATGGGAGGAGGAGGQGGFGGQGGQGGLGGSGGQGGLGGSGGQGGLGGFGGQGGVPSGGGGPGGGPTCTPEICDGIDNDCNGVIDDVPDIGEPCSTGKPGPCAAGTIVCQGGQEICADTVKPEPEQCNNGIDEDCDGLVDDGCGPPVGCSDGTREGFEDLAQYPQIAGCSGGFTVPGLITTLQPTCGRNAGNSSGNPSGTGCSVADLCAEGFHVCGGPAEVAAKSPTGCGGAADAPNLFFATRQSSSGCGACALGANVDPIACTGCSCAADCAQTALTANDLFGCGTLGDTPPGACGILDRFSNNLCDALGGPWSCGNDGCDEANQVTKPGSGRGGVLCCAD